MDILGWRFTIKSLRHTFSQVLKEMGIDDYTRAKWLGHANPNVTNKVYTHQTQKLTAQACDIVIQQYQNYIT